MTTSTRTPPRALAPIDRARILAEANQWANSRAFLALRMRAMVLLALSGALRTKEFLALELDQVLELEQWAPGARWTVRSSGYLRAHQSKGRRRGERQWDSSGMFVIAKDARAALRMYITAALKRGWMKLEKGQPLFIVNKNSKTRTANGQPRRMSRRSAQHAWKRFQRRAGVQETYGLHCLRHEAITRFAHKSKDPHAVAAYARFSLSTAMRYVHHNPLTIAEIAESVN